MKIPPQVTGGSFRGNIEELRGRKDPEAMKAVAKELEALFAHEMIKAMRETSVMNQGGFGKDTYMSLFDMELSRLFANRGLGLKEMLFKGLTEQAGLSHGADMTSREMKTDNLDTRFNSQMPKEGVQRQQPRDSGRSTLPERNISFEKHSALSPPLSSPNPASAEFQLPVDGQISSTFGMRRHPIRGDFRFHHGVDIAAPEGTEIYPYRDGKVIFSGSQPGYGNTVIIDHGDGHISKYAHNRVNFVKSGDRVSDHTIIAEVGSTGVSTGPHLHFEVRQHGKPLDPEEILAMR